jgi:hypothetical protein
VKQKTELENILVLLRSWLTEIQFNTKLDFYDINKISEGLSEKLLNAIFGYELTDLNKRKKNFPGIDLGDETKNKIAFQITSRIDFQKFKENIETFVKKDISDKCLADTFTNGIKFLVITNKEIKTGKTGKTDLTAIYPKFDFNRDIMKVEDLLPHISELYCNERARFNLVKEILEDQFSSTKSKFELKFYYGDKAKFTSTISDLNIPDITESNLYNSKRSEALSLFEKISFLKIKKKKDMFGLLVSSCLKLFPKPFYSDLSFAVYKNRPVIIDTYEREQITSHCQEILCLKPDMDFFNFGELKESKTEKISFPCNQYEYSRKGKPNEKEKNRLYNDFYRKINELKDLVEYSKKLSNLSILPIVIKNSGKTHKEEIKVQLFFPKEVIVYNNKNYPIPKRLQILKDMNSVDSYLLKNIKHSQDSVVREYHIAPIVTQLFEPPFSHDGLIKLEKKKYRSMLNHSFDYEYYNDNSEFQILKCEINELNTNEYISLPSYISIYSKFDFTVKYKISCKNESESIEGELYYRASR